MTRVVLAAFVISLLPGIARADDDPPPGDQPGEQPPPVEPVPTQPTQPTSEEPEPPQHYEKPMVQTGIHPKEIVIEVPGLRTTNQKIVVGSLLGAGAIGGAIGLYFNLQSRSDANKVNAATFTGKAWTADREQSYDSANSNRNRAAVGYAIGGAFVIGAIAAFIATEPKSETTVIRPHAAVVPTSGGAFATYGGSF